MKKFYLILLLPFLLTACFSEDSGRYNKSTTDGITMSIDYVSYQRLTKTLDERDMAYVHIYSSVSGDIDSTALYLDGYLIENILQLPWERDFRSGMLNYGDHEFLLVHTNNNVTDSLRARFFTNNNRGIINIFFPSN